MAAKQKKINKIQIRDRDSTLYCCTDSMIFVSFSLMPGYIRRENLCKKQACAIQKCLRGIITD